MKVYKFGGASIKNAEGIKNLLKIVSKEESELIIVVSASGKMTNALEQIMGAWFDGDIRYQELLDRLIDYHNSILNGLSFSPESEAFILFNRTIDKLKSYLLKTKKGSYDFEYDQIIPYGELISSIIVFEYLKSELSGIELVDIRTCIKTDDRFRDANIEWEQSVIRTNSIFNFLNTRIYITQGFIAGTAEGDSSTLGREGSDYTAAVLANMLNAESVTVWKDVPGILNADPVWMDEAQLLEEISYREAVEMTFSGAKVIHPKTIKPLHNKKIPLYVRSFINPSSGGTVIKSDAVLKRVIPVFIKKENQILISIIPRDFSFVMDENLSRIFHVFMQHGIKVNLVEASAVSIDVCVDDERRRIDALIESMNLEFALVYNESVEMLTIRHYTQNAVNKITAGREILLEQRMRSTVRFVVRKN
ncbi:MAG: aspartate kinase [Bacteroidales bacterium]|nr:aspartate kinase [Bacteroidales bacterium]